MMYGEEVHRELEIQAEVKKLLDQIDALDADIRDEVRARLVKDINRLLKMDFFRRWQMENMNNSQLRPAEWHLQRPAGFGGLFG